MDQGSNVQNENLVNDQVTQAIADSGVVAPIVDAPGTVAGFSDSVVATPPVDPTPTVLSADDLPDVTPEIVASPEVSEPVVEVTPEAAPLATDTPVVAPISADMPMGTGDDDELMEVKQKALEQLSPLVSHLELPPDQKFDTYMEIIRASDDKSLIQPAFEVAQLIEDEDKKAQALLDVVNEVNYLTQDHEAAE